MRRRTPSSTVQPPRYWERPALGSDTTTRQENASASSQQMFQCSICDFSSRYHFHGRRPKGSTIVFLEEAYLLLSSSHSCAPICLGAECSLCDRIVCIECSLFYSQRFCFQCLRSDGETRLLQLPVPVQKEYHKWRGQQSETTIGSGAKAA